MRSLLLVVMLTAPAPGLAAPVGLQLVEGSLSAGEAQVARDMASAALAARGAHVVPAGAPFTMRLVLRLTERGVAATVVVLRGRDAGLVGTWTARAAGASTPRLLRAAISRAVDEAVESLEAGS